MRGAAKGRVDGSVAVASRQRTAAVLDPGTAKAAVRAAVMACSLRVVLDGTD